MAVKAHNLDAYVHRILIRMFLDERRLGWAGVRLGHTATDAATDAAELARGTPESAGVEDRLVLHAALSALPPRQRAAVVLRYLADHSVEEVAEILKVSRAPSRARRPTASRRYAGCSPTAPPTPASE